MIFTVNTEVFEGPLDLMLHLIKSNKLDLFDLDMNILTTQYCNYITTLKHQNVEIASEFLSELASLLEYKSKKLLPKENVEINSEYEVDEREKLVQRLLEYQNYKEASMQLEQAFSERQLLLSKPLSEESQNYINESAELITGTPYDLMKAMQKVIKRQSMLRPDTTTLNVKEVSLEERTKTVELLLQKYQEPITFDKLCEDCVNLGMVVVTFLVILDFMKNQKIFVEVVDDKILIKRKNYA